jgi:hypothetical protein
MTHFTIPLLVIGLLVLTAAITSWIVYPAWRQDPAGVLGVSLAAMGGVVASLKSIGDLLKTWRDLRKREREYQEAPLKACSPERILGDTKGGMVSFINRGATDRKLLYQHSRVIISGPMKMGKTREAAELIRWAIEDELVGADQVFEPGRAFRELDAAELAKKLRWEHTGKSVLLFLDDLPKEILPGQEEKWSAALQALRQCPECYVVATARSDQMGGIEKWLAKEGFQIVTLRGLQAEEVEKLTLAAGGIFRLQLSEAARQEFIRHSDGRPETTLIGLRRLEAEGEAMRLVEAKEASRFAQNGLEDAWAAVVRNLEENHPGARYWLEALGVFYGANVRAAEGLLKALALQEWRQVERWVWRRGGLLKKALGKMEQYDIRVRDGYMRFPEVAVEGRVDTQSGRARLAAFLKGYRKSWRGKVLGRLNSNRTAQADALFRLAFMARDEKQETIALYSHAIAINPPSILLLQPGNQLRQAGAARTGDRGLRPSDRTRRAICRGLQ